MIPKTLHKTIYSAIVGALEGQAKTRNALMDELISGANFSREDMDDSSLNSAKNVYRSKVGSVITEMLANGVIEEGEGGAYRLAYTKPSALRIESCEREILKLLTKSPATKQQIRTSLASYFGTDKTATKRDDGRLNDFIGKNLARLTEAAVIAFDGEKYSLSKKALARADDINAILALKSEFLTKLHSKGGEFFEHYFMNLLSRYLTKQKKTVVECKVSGGSADGGIDGIARTVDSLGFRETVMVQTKNRNIVISETDVRGFYGAVCARQGSRGIYVTTSDFHSGARAFLDSIDNCVGVNGDRIFRMAVECGYGIKKCGGALTVDERVI